MWEVARVNKENFLRFGLSVSSGAIYLDEETLLILKAGCFVSDLLLSPTVSSTLLCKEVNQHHFALLYK